MPSLFITATGTDVGKTFVTVKLIRALRARGIRVSALKPIISGFDAARPAGSDSALLLEALGRPTNTAELDAISPWRFKAPLSPDMAARKEGRPIDFDKVLAFCRSVSLGNDGLVLIEGAGGIMVPINQRFTMLDLMRELGEPVLLIGGTYLGAISHLLSALGMLSAHGLSPRAIVINESESSHVTLQDTVETLAHFCGDTPLIARERQSPLTTSDAACAALIGALNIA